MLLEAHLDGPLTRAGLLPWVYALAAWDVDWLRRNPRAPKLYASGVRYRPDPIGSAEDFRTVPRVLAAGSGDCDDLAAWRVAELRLQGVRAHPDVIKIKQGLWHVFVRLPGGGAEDPSAHLGMTVPQRFIDAGKRRLARQSHPHRENARAHLPRVAAAWPGWR